MRHSIRFAALAFGLNILLCANVTQAQQQMRIVDDQGKPVKTAQVTIISDKEKREGFADAGGKFGWAPMLPGSICVVNIVSSRTAYFAAVLVIPASGIVNVEYKVERKQVQVIQVTVIDDEKKVPVSGVEVNFNVKYFITTNGSGVAEFEKSILDTNCTITIDHKMYEPIERSFRVPGNMFEPFRVEVRVKRKINIQWVRFTVIDNETGKPIEDAYVSIQNDSSFFSGHTGTSGVTDILIDRPGTFNSAVYKDKYYPNKSTPFVFVTGGESVEILNATISLLKVPRGSGRVLPVKVMGKRLDGTIITLKNAKVYVEERYKANTVTDADGKATVKLPEYSDFVYIVATAYDYESETKLCLLPQDSTVIIAPEVVFILTGKKLENTAVNLIIKVTKRDDGKPVSSASVSIDGLSTTKTDSAGNARITISNEFIKDKQYLRAMVTKPDFKEKWSDIGIDLLKPGEEPRYYSIAIEPSRKSPDDIFLGTWNGTGNAKGITMTFNKDYTMTFSDARPVYERSGKGVWHRDPDRVDCVASPINYSLWYGNGKLVDPWGNFYVK